MVGYDVTRPSLSKARYTKIPDYHRVRSLRDLNPAFTTKTVSPRPNHDVPPTHRGASPDELMGQTENRE